MRRLFFIMAVVTAIFVRAEVKIDWINTSDDFGRIAEDGGKVDLMYRGVNVGDEPLVIINAKSSCGCTRPSYPRGEIAPGDTFCVTAAFDPAFQVGLVTKKITLTTNAEPKSHSLTVKGIVLALPSTVETRFPVGIGDMRLEKASVNFGDVTRGKTKLVFLDVYNNGSDTIKPAWSDRPAHLSLSSSPQRLEPLEKGVIAFYASATSDKHYGLVTDSVTIVAKSSNSAETLKIPVTAHFVEYFGDMTDRQLADAPIARLSDSLISCGQILPNAEGVERFFSVENRGKSTLMIRRIYASSPYVKIRRYKEKVKSGKSSKITFWIDPDMYSPDAPIVDETITVVTNDPQNPELSVRVTAEYF